ncbi:DUF6371 domain-containing protein [Flavobacterium croceum]|uniref:DUF6371 domain-containing protein n=1 Tax=Flavobacterium croceum TaxID=370975 RepID=UPI0024A9BF0B|nr:DUF6371 domain-containing protein [Flavobacterium croceum]
MNESKYSLDKSSKKFVCPNCGKRRFVRYLNQITNEYLEETYGRCDRETSCGYRNNPKQNECIAIVNIERINLIPDFIDPLLVKQSLKKYCNNNFAKFLYKHFAKDEVENCIAKYNIGTSKHWEGATVFWQINQNQKVHAGKIILFDENTGKRVKNPFPHINWVHKKINKDKFNLKQCLFGLHLNKTGVATSLQKPIAIPLQYHCNTIAIVESEKTAIIMSLFIPEYLWMATGSKQNLKLQLLEPIKKENIVVYPDKGEFEDWNKKVIELQKQGFKIKCSSIIENSEFETGTDLADVYFAKRNNVSENKIEIVLSETEKKIQRLSKINPSIISLIETFDLIDEKGNGIFCRTTEY